MQMLLEEITRRNWEKYEKSIALFENSPGRYCLKLAWLFAQSCLMLLFVDHFFIFQKNSLHLKLANFSSLKRRSIFTSRKILREKLELHSASKKSLNIAKMVPIGRFTFAVAFTAPVATLREIGKILR